MTTHTTRRALIGGAGLAAVVGGLALTMEANGAALSTVDRTAWDRAFRLMTIKKAKYDASAASFDARHDGADKATQAALHAEFERLGDISHDATWALFAIPAPDHAALLWKTEYLFADNHEAGWSGASWSHEVMDWYLADQRRLLGPVAG